MKKTIFAFLIVLAAGYSQAQWTTLNSTTTSNLHDVDFLTPDYGAIVGNNGTVLLTTDGGLNWADISNHLVSGDVYSVTVKNTDTLYVSTYDFNNQSGLIYKTDNGGASWDTIATDNILAHKIDLALPVSSRLYAIGHSLVSTTNSGTVWDTLSNNVSGTTILDILKFNDPQVGHLSGIISGFSSYSAYFFRTDDAGSSWFRGDVFSFPNADALTTMCFRGGDTAYVFTNHYSGFMPSATNGLVKIYGFQKTSPFPGDTVFSFSNQVMNASMPAFMNDAIYLSNDSAYAMGNNGTVYKTTDGGVTWTSDYAAGSPLFSVVFKGGIGYAVGDNGTLIKYALSSTPVTEIASLNIDVHPLLANDLLIVNTGEMNSIKFEITSITGAKIETGLLHPNDNMINVSKYAEGSYIMTFHVKNKIYTKKFAISH